MPGNAAYYRQRRHDAKARRLLAAVIEPTAERRARGDVVRLERQIADFVGALANTYRSLDTLELMERRGSIGPDDRRAGDRFHNLFRWAALDSGFVVSDPTRIPVRLAGWRKVGARGDETARNEVFAALDALGHKTSPHRACAWNVLGCEMSLTAWAATTGWSEVQRIGRDEAGEILKKTLALLRRYWAIQFLLALDHANAPTFSATVEQCAPGEVTRLPAVFGGRFGGRRLPSLASERPARHRAPPQSGCLDCLTPP